MKKWILLILIFSVLLLAQTVTPNLKMILPQHGATNWDIQMNQNLAILDNIVGSVQTAVAKPRMFWTGSMLCGATISPCEDSARITPDNPIVITRFQLLLLTPPAGCSTNYQVSVRDVTSSVNLITLTAGNGTSIYDSGTVFVPTTAGHVLVINNTTGASGCSTNPANNGFSVQYEMQ